MTTYTDSDILKKLAEQEKEGGELPPLFELYRKLLDIQSRAKKRIGTPKPDLSNESIGHQINRGVSLLRFEDLSLDWSLLHEVFAEVIAAFADYPELFGELPEKLRKPEANRLLTRKAVKAWYEETELPSPILAGAASENLLRAIIHATLQPFLTSHSKALIGSVDQERWRRRYCPICGSQPDFAFLDKERGSRWLLCSRCDTEWVFKRLECPYCGTQDQKSLAYFTDDEGLYRLYVCEQCKRYLKTIDLSQAKSEVLLPLERLYTLDLDSQAQIKGYHPCDRPAS